MTTEKKVIADYTYLLLYALEQMHLDRETAGMYRELISREGKMHLKGMQSLPVTMQNISQLFLEAEAEAKRFYRFL